MTNVFLILLGISVLFKILSPPRPNWLYGYRTPRSLKDIDAWKLANRYSANLTIIVSCALTAISLVCDQFTYDTKNILTGLMLLGFALVIYLTETKLKRNEKSKQP